MKFPTTIIPSAAALLSAPADDPNAQRLRVAGHMVAMTEMPVVNRRVAGDVIAEAHRLRKNRTDRLRRDTTRPEPDRKIPDPRPSGSFAIRSAKSAARS